MRITTFINHETLMNQVTLLRDALRPHLAWRRIELCGCLSGCPAAGQDGEL